MRMHGLHELHGLGSMRHVDSRGCARRAVDDDECRGCSPRDIADDVDPFDVSIEWLHVACTCLACLLSQQRCATSQ